MNYYNCNVNFRFKLNIQRMYFLLRNNCFYLILINFYFQLSSDRYYNRFVFNAFRPERLLFLMNYCNSDSFRTYVRLQSYTCHEFCYDLPIFSFFNYSFMYANRDLNRIEMLLFRICRNNFSNQTSIVVNNIESFEANLNKRFGFCFIKNIINFSLFVMAGKI
jgi:hypothetical protein